MVSATSIKGMNDSLNFIVVFERDELEAKVQFFLDMAHSLRAFVSGISLRVSKGCMNVSKSYPLVLHTFQLRFCDSRSFSLSLQQYEGLAYLLPAEPVVTRRKDK